VRNNLDYNFFAHSVSKLDTFMTNLLSVHSNWFARQQVFYELVALVATRNTDFLTFLENKSLESAHDIYGVNLVLVVC